MIGEYPRRSVERGPRLYDVRVGEVRLNVFTYGCAAIRYGIFGGAGEPINPKTIMKTLLTTIGMVLFASTTLIAQDMKGEPTRTDKHACIMADAGTWTDLGLSAEQLEKVKVIQTSCKKEYEAAKAAGTKYTEASRHEADLKTVLTPDQYTKWSQWCSADRAAKPVEGSK